MLGFSANSARVCLASSFLLVVAQVCLGRQSPPAISEFFEGRAVVVRIDMPGTQQGVDVYPQRPQALDLKSYSNRVKQYGVSLHNGDQAIVTKVKVKDGNVEFQLAGGGYGTSGDDTDTAVHFTPSEKSGREKELESRVKNEQNPDRRKGLQRELDEVRSFRERRDRHDQQIAEQNAEAKKQMVLGKRMQGGSRFNLRIEKGSEGSVTPQVIMASLQGYMTFPPEAFEGSPSARSIETGRNGGSVGAPPPSPAAAGPGLSLRKGLTREQVDALYGAPSEAHESNQTGLSVLSCIYQDREHTVKADFVNGVLVQYTVSSR